MSKFLKQKWSGHIFVWSQRLAERDDMEPYEPPKAAPPPAPKPPVAPPSKPKTPTQNSSPEPVFPPLDDAIEAFRKEVARPIHEGKVKHESLGHHITSPDPSQRSGRNPLA
jgi:hypothetical protein